MNLGFLHNWPVSSHSGFKPIVDRQQPREVLTCEANGVPCNRLLVNRNSDRTQRIVIYVRWYWRRSHGRSHRHGLLRRSRAKLRMLVSQSQHPPKSSWMRFCWLSGLLRNIELISCVEIEQIERQVGKGAVFDTLDWAAGDVSGTQTEMEQNMREIHEIWILSSALQEVAGTLVFLSMYVTLAGLGKTEPGIVGASSHYEIS